MNLGSFVDKVKAAFVGDSAAKGSGEIPAIDSPPVTEAARIVESYCQECSGQWYGENSRDYPSGRAALDASPEFQIAVIHEIYDDLVNKRRYALEPLLVSLLARNQPFTASDFERLLALTRKNHPNTMKLPSLLRQVKRFAETGPGLTPQISEQLETIRDSIRKRYQGVDSRKLLMSLDDLLGGGASAARPDPGETWSDLVLADLDAMESEARTKWERLFYHAQSADGAKPTAAWTKSAVENVGPLSDALVNCLPKWFSSLTTPPMATHTHEYQGRTWQTVSPRLSERNLSMLKGLAWCCAGRSEPELARALAKLTEGSLKKIPGTGPWAVRVSGAAVWALGEMNCMEAVASLSRLRLKVTHRGTLTQIDKAIEAVAKRQGVARDDLEDLAVPTYGLDPDGRRRDEFGEYSAEVSLDPAGSVNIAWFGPGGKPLKSVPAPVKKDHAAELKTLKADVDSAQKTLSAQRQRIEGFLLTGRTWSLGQWRDRYFEHPLLGHIVRRLIWRFGDGDDARAGVWGTEEKTFVDANGKAIEGPADDVAIRLWHPINASVEQIERWRGFLETRQIRQPFKQAYREVYLLTDAEIRTATYSNRFASHILKQHQMNTLALQRGWKNKLRLMVDDEYPPAHLVLPQYGLRAEFWVEGAGEDINDTGTYLYLATDQVRFYRIDAALSSHHAWGGGYRAARPGGDEDPLPLNTIPPLVFSEVMRDVDLFVGVASVGNDPTWADGGPGRHRAYWQEYSFGELTATAQTRAEVLTRLIPKLNIAAKCRIDGRFLIVRGDLRTYKIHLGSSNILMEPNDQYLCIVQAPSSAAQATGNVFLPFEGDTRLSVILSKAFLLADDKNIKDPTITRQIKR